MTAVAGPAIKQQLVDSLPSAIRHYIDGEHVDSVDGATIAVTDPVGHEQYCTLAAGGSADISKAVAAARRAFVDGPWAGLSARRRSNTLNAIANAIESRAETLAAFETFDTGLRSPRHTVWQRVRQRTSATSRKSAARSTKTRSAAPLRSATRSVGRRGSPASSPRGTCHSCSPRGSWRRAWPPAAPSC